jgi:hypothetical protein
MLTRRVERRLEPRLLCADLIDVRWKDKRGSLRRAVANLEDISLSGMCLQMDAPIPRETLLRIAHAKTRFQARVRYCVFRETGYYVGVEFEPGCRWSRRQFRPKHLLDPRDLLAASSRRGERRPSRPGAGALH